MRHDNSAYTKSIQLKVKSSANVHNVSHMSFELTAL